MSVDHRNTFFALVTIAIRACLASADDYEYLGCYTDSTSERALSGTHFQSDNLTVANCYTFCASDSDYAYFGVEDGKQCYCGYSDDSYSRYGASDTCKSKCKGNKLETCGGWWVVDVYSIQSNTDNEGSSGDDGSSGSNDDDGTSTGSPPSSLTYSYLGCFQDNATRVLSGPELLAYNMTLDVCFDYCKDYPYFGVEYRYQCYCGETNDDYAVLGAVSTCSTYCDGNSSEICGGHWSLSMYSNGAYTSIKEDIIDPEELLDSNVQGRLRFMRRNKGLGFAFVMMAMVVIGIFVAIKRYKSPVGGYEKLRGEDFAEEQPIAFTVKYRYT